MLRRLPESGSKKPPRELAQDKKGGVRPRGTWSYGRRLTLPSVGSDWERDSGLIRDEREECEDPPMRRNASKHEQ